MRKGTFFFRKKNCLYGKNFVPLHRTLLGLYYISATHVIVCCWMSAQKMSVERINQSNMDTMIDTMVTPSFSWYPMRVTYSREEKVKEALDRLEVENFLPMRYDLVKNKDGKPKRKLVPAVPNLIFVHSTQAVITELKMTRRELQPLRYMTDRVADRVNHILCIPDRQMQNFMRVAKVQDDTVFFLQTNDYLNKEGQRVRVVDGDFAGVEGVIKRVKRNKHVVVQLEGLVAVAIAYIPGAYLQLID